VPNLPPHFLPRPVQLNFLKNQVLANTNQPVAITGKSRSVGVQGMGGIGKTVLATALARDEEVRSTFPDGVLWVTLGQTPQLSSLF
jgi:NB-ARC domain